MKKWSHETIINAPIEDVWTLFDNTLEQTKKIMPGILSVEPIKETENKVGSVYRQGFRARKDLHKYDVETLEYEDTPDHKRFKTGFTIPRLLEITSLYELTRLEDGKTKFFYESTNVPLRWHMRILLLFAGKKSVVTFVDQVKNAAESKA